MEPSPDPQGAGALFGDAGAEAAHLGGAPAQRLDKPQILEMAAVGDVQPTPVNTATPVTIQVPAAVRLATVGRLPQARCPAGLVNPCRGSPGWTPRPAARAGRRTGRGAQRGRAGHSCGRWTGRSGPRGATSRVNLVIPGSETSFSRNHRTAYWKIAVGPSPEFHARASTFASRPRSATPVPGEP